MQKFSTLVRLVSLEYARMMYAAFYRKPLFIILTIIGLYFMITVLLYYAGLIRFYTATPYFELFCGALLLLFPSLIVLMSVLQAKKSPAFKDGVRYTFSEAGVSMEISTGRTDVSWAHFTGCKDSGLYLMLNQNKRTGYILDKRQLSDEQVAFIHLKCSGKSINF